MSNFLSFNTQLIESMCVDDLTIPVTGVKIYSHSDTVPDILMNFHPDSISLTSCQANKQASLGDTVLLTKANIGCIAAAITFGIVDQNDPSPLKGSRTYTDIMKNQSGKEDKFTPPSPKEFTDGIVYACKHSGRNDFALFGQDDSGRYKDVDTAKSAIRDMMAIQPPTTQAVLFFPPDFKDLDIEPDVVVMSIRPVELTRIVQAYQFITGKRVVANIGALRVVNSDLIVRPYLTKEINVSTYCLGARLIGQYEANRLGIGLPYDDYKIVAKGMEASKTGYPFQLYPGADESNL